MYNLFNRRAGKKYSKSIVPIHRIVNQMLSCPVCQKILAKKSYGVSAHLNAHVRRSEITKEEKFNIMSESGFITQW